MKVDKFRVTAQKIALTKNESQDDLEVESTYLLTGTTRGFAESHVIDLSDNKVAEFVFEDNTTWLCGSDSISELFPETVTKKRSVDSVFELPPVLGSATSADRSIVSGIAIKLINVFAKKKVQAKVRDLAEKFELQRLDNLVGLFHLNEDFQLQNISKLETSNPYLLFIHGTASSTEGSFAELKGSDVWKYIRQTYGNNVLALQHRSLTENPLQNVQQLVEKLPHNITLHLITHSRGGLIGDILCRFSNTGDSGNPFTKDEINNLKDRKDDVKQIESISKILKRKNINVRKFIRVACPAAGTTLASKRMDIYFNIIGNLAGLLTGASANPFFAAFKNLVATIIQSKNNVEVLPGIEAMNPESPFIKVLNNKSANSVIDSPLAVVSGNCGLSFSLKALKIIASRLFFLQNNDLVVNSESMYLGANRKEGAVQYFFDDADNVDHFHYFSNKKTTDAILLALKTEPGEMIPGFQIFDAATTKQLRRIEGGRLDSDVITGKRPIVILLPGIMGSNIGEADELVWINYGRFLKGDLMELKDLNNHTASSLVKTAYGDLKWYLSEKYDVRTYPFDWRKSLAVTAGELETEIKKLMKFNQPIKVVAHSMGGVLFRDFMVLGRSTWDILKKSNGFQLVFLGAPLGGSFRIPYVIFGKDPIIKKLSLIDICHSKRTLIGMFSQMPGLMSLLPFDKIAGTDMTEADTWKSMAKAFGDEDWPTPDSKLLADFADHRTIITDGIKETDYEEAVYVAGKDKATPMGYLIEEDTNGSELIFLSTSEGDQSVTWESGIPRKMIENDSVYYVNATHGALSFERSLFKGIGEILDKGATNLFSKKRPVTRGEEKIFETPEVYDFDLSPAGLETTLLSLDNNPVKPQAGAVPIHVRVSKGDLLYSSYPLLAGHFEGDAILFAEDAINKHLDGILNKRHQLSLYPGPIGSSEVVVASNKKIKGAIIIGLGRPGELTAYQLVRSIEQGVSSYLLHINNGLTQSGTNREGQRVGISSLIIGCGYGGLSVENSVRAIVEGVQNANVKIRNLFGPNCQLADEIEFIEKFEDRALACFHSLSRIETEQSRYLNIVSDHKTIKTLLGSVRRMPHEATEQWWNRITVKSEKPADADSYDDDVEELDIKLLKFSASTGGAREENKSLESNTNLIEELVEDISTRDQWSAELAKTIFELIIPNDFKEQLKKQCNINWIVDAETAAYPWELLQDTVSNAKPLCINAGMIRQLATSEYRTVINRVTKNNALIISEPELNGFAPALPGAFMEGELVNKILTDHKFITKPVAKGLPSQIIRALFEDDYKIIHLSGHGMFNEALPQNSGMLIGDNVFLTSREITQMSTVPEFVFINCCFLAKERGLSSKNLYKNRSKLAASIGTELIRNGVKAVIAAGWAVNDDAALEFCRVFYEHMFAGYAFGYAVLQARKSIYEKFPFTNTWGAYHCYGDPFYKLDIRSTTEKKQTTIRYVIAQEADYDLYNLIKEIEMGNNSVDENVTHLHAISDAVDKAGIRNAAITEKEALVYRELCLYEQAIAKFVLLLNMEDADFSFSSMEKYCNVRAKSYLRKYFISKDKNDVKELIAAMDIVITDLEALLKAGKTAERYNLVGSTYKRKAILLNSRVDKIQAYKQAAKYYYQAAIKTGNSKEIYALTNWLELETILQLLGENSGIDTSGKGGISVSQAVERLEVHLTKIDPSPDNYWPMVSAMNIELCFLLMKKKSAAKIEEWNKLTDALITLWKKAGSPGMKTAEIEHILLLEHALTMNPIIGELSGEEDNIAPEEIEYAKIGVYVEKLRQALESLNISPGNVQKQKDNRSKKTAAKKFAVKKTATKKGRKKISGK